MRLAMLGELEGRCCLRKRDSDEASPPPQGATAGATGAETLLASRLAAVVEKGELEEEAQ